MIPYPDSNEPRLYETVEGAIRDYTNFYRTFRRKNFLKKYQVLT